MSEASFAILGRLALTSAAICAARARKPYGPRLRRNSHHTVKRCPPKHCTIPAVPSPANAIASIRGRSSRHKRCAILKTLRRPVADISGWSSWPIRRDHRLSSPTLMKSQG